ncbi:MAG: LytTR family DNA-binding domain-containing protein [Bacteroidota bacterium]
MKILIAEDELVLAHTTAEMMRGMGYTNIEIGHTFAKAKAMLENMDINIALLDINLGKGDEGIELAKVCVANNIPFIYISSYSDKATLDKALQTNPGAYLTKPISEGNLYATLQILLVHLKEDLESTVLSFKDGTELIKLPLKKVLYLRSENVYVNVVTETKTFLFRGSLGALISKVPKGALIQTHRAYAVNPTHIQRMSSTHIILHNENEIPVSRSYKVQIPKD